MSIRYLVPEPVVQYIEANRLYEEDGGGSSGEKGKDPERKAGESGGVAPGSSRRR